MSRRITFGICTYNRKDLLIKSIQSLKRIDRLDEINIRVYDDASTEYDIDFIKEMLPEVKVIKRKRNGGADLNTSLMYKDFLESGDEILFNADSDLVYSQEIVQIINDLLPKTDGFFTVFNTPSHQKTLDFDDDFICKDIVGAAGCCLNRDTVELILKMKNNFSNNFDTNMCIYLKKKGYRILSTRKSYVQHIGISGQNSDFYGFDYGRDFAVSNMEDAQLIEQAFEEYMSSLYEFQKTNVGRLIHIIIAGYRRINNLGSGNKGLSIKQKNNER